MTLGVAGYVLIGRVLSFEKKKRKKKVKQLELLSTVLLNDVFAVLLAWCFRTLICSSPETAKSMVS